MRSFPSTPEETRRILEARKSSRPEVEVAFIEAIVKCRSEQFQASNISSNKTSMFI
jgi:hypothetical protein